MINYISKALEKPALYAKTENEFWDDEHISTQMLQAHLDPLHDGASRSFEFIEKSATGISKMIPSYKYQQLLDLGCGPGLYAERFWKLGYQVTGVDISRCSINYAKKSALKQKLNIIYYCQNYLMMNLGKEFDLCTMIYCDYGALSIYDRQTMMKKVYQHLKPGGKFLLDVFSMVKYDEFQERRTWERCLDGGFWSANKYVALTECYKYTENVTLEQISVISEHGFNLHYLWTTYFTKDTLIKEARDTGFKVCEVFEDVAGKPYCDKSPTIAILLEK